MLKINWHQLEKNIETKEISFENFNYQIAVKKYSSFGTFEYYYNTPGSEFYLTLTKDCNELSAKAGDVVGWQSKFWLNKTDPNNSPLDIKHRNELIEGFKKSLKYKPALKVWIICTPGLFSNTAPHYPVNVLEAELKKLKSDINIVYWNKPFYESIFHSDPEYYASIFNHYFSTHYLGFQIFHDFSIKRLNILRTRYDTDLYTSGKEDKKILSSIFYRDLLSRLHKEIKHALEYREKLTNSYLYKEVINKFLNEKDNGKITNESKESIKNLKELIDNLLEVLGALQIYNEKENTLRFVKELFNSIEEQREKINESIHTAGLDDRPHYDININFDSDVEDIYVLRNYLYSIAGSFLDKVIKIYRLLFHISRQVFNIFGEAGFGKTNLVCYITEHLLSKKLPALLIPASEIKGNGEPIERQILNLLGIDGTVTFKDFIGILDSLGFLHGIKIPIIIDGLNETQPSASIWHPNLQYIIQDIENYENIILITTCRDAYTKPVFNKERIKDIPYSIRLEGFQENIEEAINKYFKKYNITPQNEDFDKNLFRNPLLLRLFSIANRDKTIEINEANIYIAIETYIKEIIDKVSIQDGIVNPLFKSQISKGIQGYSICLWENNSRGVPYPDDIIKYFDPDYTGKNWHTTKTYRIIDEGLLFRNIHEAKEYVEFTHDVVGGFCIAKEVIFKDKNIEDVIRTLRSNEVLEKLTSKDTAKRHPLAEDILKAIVYLCPVYTNKELFELIDNTEFLNASLAMLRIIISKEEGMKSFIEHFKNIEVNNPIVSHLLESVISELILNRKGYWRLSEVLASIIIRMEAYQIDLIWSELIRRKSKDIILYLHQEIRRYEEDKGEIENITEKLIFISLLLSSTNRYLRDMATKALVIIGEKQPEKLFEVFDRLETIKDFYVLERLIASICGVFLRIDNKELLLKVCRYFEDNYFATLKTSHVLILDYIDTLLNYAMVHYGYRRSKSLSEVDLIEWKKDNECAKEVTGDGRATWGFGPVDYDFAKYKIGAYLSSRRFEKDSKLPTLKESLAMVVWRAKELGYSKELFEQIDIQINKERYDRYGQGVLQNYGKKYSKIAFYELFGYNIIKGFSRSFKDKAVFRVSVTDIDPTFPKKPHKRQLITCCFLPKKNDDVQTWINIDKNPYLEEDYIRTDIENAGKEWVMLYGHLTQESNEKARIDVSVYTILVPQDVADKFVEKIKRNELSMLHFVSENHYIMAGEIPWSSNLDSDPIYEGINGEKIEIHLPVSVYYREAKSDLEITNHIYFPSKKVAQELGLRINLNNFNFYTTSNETASIFLHDDYSNFLFMRRDLIQDYMKRNKQLLIWIELGTRWGSFGNYESKYDPPFKNFRFCKLYQEV
jgi:hypothetical protein